VFSDQSWLKQGLRNMHTLRQHGTLSCMFTIFALPSAKMENEEKKKVPLCRRRKTLTT
jgi:hypothetical protein